ncbi:GNAT family N-acetyltransferase [Herbiconiux daphne]|uniref:N-acetyltransferase n=1 Tax=Herbiconiux daphne TaxID=2970914 RepID=A0ABT2H7I2_9MICO|nr:GNAT family N-acetyltransferase [Herbiconiux daphne]MCS5735852.1 N-acetyltransferase [Herbiconiux daphne]
MSTEIRNESDQSRYTITVDGELAGFADYTITGTTIVFTRTEVDPTKRQAGLGAQLVQFALDDVRTSGTLAVVPKCSFVAHFIDSHPDYQELVDRG